MKSCSDRLPRGPGLCVLFHADQLLVMRVGPRTGYLMKWSSWNRVKDTQRWGRWSFWIGCQGKCRCAKWSSHRAMVVVDRLRRSRIHIT